VKNPNQPIAKNPNPVTAWYHGGENRQQENNFSQQFQQAIGTKGEKGRFSRLFDVCSNV